jgi:hypothetical protein
VVSFPHGTATIIESPERNTLYQDKGKTTLVVMLFSDQQPFPRENDEPNL